MNDIFEIASRNRFRYTSSAGPLTTEELWDLPLKADRRNGANLNDIAVALHRDVKAAETESFVDDVPKANKATEIKLEVVKAVIAHKKALIKAAETRAANAAQIEKIRNVIVDQQDAALKTKTPEELQALLASLAAAPAASEQEL